MLRFVRVLLAVLAIAGLTLAIMAQSPSRPVLPRGWKALGLTDSQKAQVYKVQTDYSAKIADLQKQIKDLRPGASRPAEDPDASSARSFGRTPKGEDQPHSGAQA